MNIILVPNRRDDTLSVVKNGSVLTINGEDLDLTQLVSGSTLPDGSIDSVWLVGDQTNVDGVMNISLLFPLPANYSEEQAFPKPLLDVPDGEVIFPAPLPEPEPEPAPVLERDPFESENEVKPADEEPVQ